MWTWANANPGLFAGLVAMIILGFIIVGVAFAIAWSDRLP